MVFFVFYEKRVKYKLDDNKLYFLVIYSHLAFSLSLFFFLHKTKETMKVI